MDSVNGAGVGTKAASDALIVIHNGKIVLHGDSAVGAGTRALGTAYTTVRTHLSGQNALIVIGASDGNQRALLHHTDSSVRTVFRAQTASGTET